MPTNGLPEDPHRPERIPGSRIDITARKRMEEASRKETQGIHECLVDGLAVADAETREILQVNQAMCRLFGYSSQEFMSKHIADLHPPEAMARVTAHLAALAKGEEWLVTNIPCVRADGHPFIADIGGHTMSLEGRRCLIAFFRDATERLRNEEALQSSMERTQEQFAELSQIYRYSPVGLCVLDRDLRYLRINERLAAINGRTVEEHLGRTVYEVIPDLAEQFQKFWQPVLDTGEPLLDIEIQGRTPKEPQNTRHWLASFIPMKSVSGEVTGLMSSVVEITDRKRAETALQESREQLRALSDNLADGMVYQINSGPDGSQRRLTHLSPAVERLHELKREHVIDNPMLLYDQVIEEDRALLEKQEAHAHSTRTALDIDVRVKLPSGSIRWRQFVSAPRMDSDGNVLWDGIETDITDHKLAEEALRESEARLKEAQHIARLGSWTYDLIDRVTWSEEMYRICGISPQTGALSPPEYLNRVHLEDRPQMQAWIESCRAGDNPGELEFRIILPDGTIRFISGRGQLVCDPENRPLFMAGTSQDITERKQAEEEREELQAQLRQAQKMEAVGRLSGGIAHDFNNLLTVIQGNVEIASLLLQTALTEQNIDKIVAALGEVAHASERAARLTGQLLTFSRKHLPHIHVLDVGVVVCDTEKMLRRLIREDIVVDIVCSPGEHLIEADRTQIEQILVNLALNAKDAMPDGGKLVIQIKDVTLDKAHAKRHGGANTGPHVLLSVSDTGIGIDANTLDHLFEPFFTTKSFGKGSGLGLAIVYGIVKQSGGHIAVKSKPGKGSTFNLYFPAAQGEVSKQTAPPTSEWEHGDETILLCEDEASLRRLAASMLTQCGYAVIEAEDGEQALRLAANFAGRFQLLITDVVMPGLGGDKVAAAIRKNQPEVSVLLMSGYTSDAMGFDSDSQGGMEFLQKPFKPEVLLRRVREVLDKTIPKRQGKGTRDDEALSGGCDVRAG